MGTVCFFSCANGAAVFILCALPCATDLQCSVLCQLAPVLWASVMDSYVAVTTDDELTYGILNSILLIGRISLERSNTSCQKQPCYCYKHECLVYICVEQASLYSDAVKPVLKITCVIRPPLYKGHNF